MQQFSNQEIAELKSRVDQIHDLLAGRGEESPAAGVDVRSTAVGRRARPKSGLLDQLSFSIQIRRIRRSHFGSAEMSGPIWDMMLDLMLASAHGRVLSASDLATGAGVPLSSGLRMISALERHGAGASLDRRARPAANDRPSDRQRNRAHGHLFREDRRGLAERADAGSLTPLDRVRGRLVARTVPGHPSHSVISFIMRSTLIIASRLIWQMRAALTSRVSPISCRLSSSKK
jgi:hypothetical protein